MSSSLPPVSTIPATCQRAWPGAVGDAGLAESWEAAAVDQALEPGTGPVWWWPTVAWELDAPASSEETEP